MLDKTEFSQPALFVAGLAAVEVLRASGPEGERTVARCVFGRAVCVRERWERAVARWGPLLNRFPPPLMPSGAAPLQVSAWGSTAPSCSLGQ